MKESQIKIKDHRDYIKTWADLENAELLKSLSAYPEEEQWMIEVFKLIQKFEKTAVNWNSKWMVGIQLSHLATKEIHLAFLGLLRKHVSLGFASMRTAAEACGFMNAIRDDKMKGEVWQSKELQGKNSKEYDNLIRERWSGQFGAELKQTYSFASEQCHPSIFKTAFSDSSRLDLENKRILHTYRFFDEPEQKVYRSMFNWMIIATFKMLLHFAEVFKKPLQSAEFVSSVSEKFAAYRAYGTAHAADIVSTIKP
jgi:hypothetical protein